MVERLTYIKQLARILMTKIPIHVHPGKRVVMWGRDGVHAVAWMLSAPGPYEPPRSLALVTGPLDEAGPTNGDQTDEETPGMAELLLGEETSRSFRRGDIIEGSVMQLDRETILVDIGAKTEGIIPANEMRSLTAEDITAIHVGDPILAYVLQTENQEGQVVLSLDRATGERG